MRRASSSGCTFKARRRGASSARRNAGMIPVARHGRSWFHLAMPFLQLLPQICFIVKAAHFKERRLDEPYQVLDTAFLLGAIRPAQLHAYAHLQRGVSEDRIPFRHLPVFTPLQSYGFPSINTKQTTPS